MGNFGKILEKFLQNSFVNKITAPPTDPKSTATATAMVLLFKRHVSHASYSLRYVISTLDKIPNLSCRLKHQPISYHQQNLSFSRTYVVQALPPPTCRGNCWWMIIIPIPKTIVINNNINNTNINTRILLHQMLTSIQRIVALSKQQWLRFDSLNAIASIAPFNDGRFKLLQYVIVFRPKYNLRHQ